MLFCKKTARNWTYTKIFLFCFILSAFFSGTANADDTQPTELDSIMSGFEDNRENKKKPGESSTDLNEILSNFEDSQATSEQDRTDVSSEENFFNIDGYVKSGASFNFAHSAPEKGKTDWQGLSRLRGELKFDLDMDFSPSLTGFISTRAEYDMAYQLRGRSEYTDQVLDNYEKDLELGETFFEATLSRHMDLKVGRQIVVWGKSDNIRVADVLNPLDIREPGLTDVEDIRLPVFMTKLDFYKRPWNFAAIAIHEIRFNKAPVFGSDFYHADAAFAEQKPDHGWEEPGNTEYAFSLEGIFSGWDAAFYYAHIFDDTPHFERKTSSGSPSLQESMVQTHASLDMAGAAFNVAMGNFLLKAEAGFFSGLEFFNAPAQTFNRTDILAGVEYSGFYEATLSLEVVNRHIHGFSQILKNKPDNAARNRVQSSIRYTRNFFHNTLTMTLAASTFGLKGEDGTTQRITFKYNMADNLEMTAGAVFYTSGRLKAYSDTGDNDRLYLEFKYSF